MKTRCACGCRRWVAYAGTGRKPKHAICRKLAAVAYRLRWLARDEWLDAQEKVA